MLTHLMVGTNDPAAAEKFYDATFEAIGVPVLMAGNPKYYRLPEGPAFGFITPSNGEPATHANGGTIGFMAKDKAAVDAWHAAGLANGGSDEGAPGKRPNAPGNAYGAYLRDPDGNKICAFCQLPEGE